jgi:hypothetical protein
VSRLSRDYPEWAHEVDARLPVAAQVVLAGNVDDLHLCPVVTPSGTMFSLRQTHQVLDDVLTANAYSVVLHWHVAAGLSVLSETAPGTAQKVVGDEVWGTRAEPTAAGLTILLDRVVRAREFRVGLVVDGAHRLSPDLRALDVHRMFVAGQFLSQDAPRVSMGPKERPGVYNTVIWLADRESALPPWLVGATRVSVVNVPQPGLAARRRTAEVLVGGLPGYPELSERERAQVAVELAEQTEGMRLAEMMAVTPAARDRGIPAHDVGDAVRFLRSGVDRSPWRDDDLLARIRDAARSLNEVVLGQPRAVRHVVDVLARAALGLSGAQSSGHPTRPKGVMFFAGPTGVGKTELAKQIAKIVFGREEAMLRFDMSEFAAEHHEARLLGAPPGYVGHGEGGELTNAVRRNPFRLLLFDEIDKANPRILDKFLQILEDGRLTDASGSTVYFTETLIVFTSNAGMMRKVKDAEGKELDEYEPVVPPGTPYPALESVVRTAIHDAFVKIGRPELMNRIGDNVVVFSYITASVARDLLRRNLDHLTAAVRKQSGYQVDFTDGVRAVLDVEVGKESRLVFGGRSVNTVVESRVLNPLGRELIAMAANARCTVTEVWEDEDGPGLQAQEGGR